MYTHKKEIATYVPLYKPSPLDLNQSQRMLGPNCQFHRHMRGNNYLGANNYLASNMGTKHQKLRNCSRDHFKHMGVGCSAQILLELNLSLSFFPDLSAIPFNLSLVSSKCFDISINGVDLPDGSNSFEVALFLDTNQTRKLTQHEIVIRSNVTRIFFGNASMSLNKLNKPSVISLTCS